MALPQLKSDAAAARIGTLTMPNGAPWAQELRNGALARVESTGLPHRRDEYWRYTTPDSLNTPDAPTAAVLHSDELPVFDAIDRLKVVFVDGVFDAAASDDLDMAGIEILCF